MWHSQSLKGCLSELTDSCYLLFWSMSLHCHALLLHQRWWFICSMTVVLKIGVGKVESDTMSQLMSVGIAIYLLWFLTVHLPWTVGSVRFCSTDRSNIQASLPMTYKLHNQMFHLTYVTVRVNGWCMDEEESNGWGLILGFCTQHITTVHHLTLFMMCFALYYRRFYSLANVKMMMFYIFHDILAH